MLHKIGTSYKATAFPALELVLHNIEAYPYCSYDWPVTA